MNASGFYQCSAFAQVMEWHGMARTSSSNETLYLKNKMSYLDVTSHPYLAEGVGLEPTSPFGQRFSSSKAHLLPSQTSSDEARSRREIAILHSDLIGIERSRRPKGVSKGCQTTNPGSHSALAPVKGLRPPL